MILTLEENIEKLETVVFEDLECAPYAGDFPEIFRLI
jgi:hypothetical protein